MSSTVRIFVTEDDAKIAISCCTKSASNSDIWPLSQKPEIVEIEATLEQMTLLKMLGKKPDEDADHLLYKVECLDLLYLAVDGKFYLKEEV